MHYPRLGEAIVPRLLRALVIEPYPGRRRDADSDLLSNLDLGPEAWTALPPDTCRRLAMTVVDRVQTRLRALPPAAMGYPLPAPTVALTLPIERRTANAIRRQLRASTPAGEEEPPSAWTVERYLSLPRFGGRALVDLLAASEGGLDGATGQDAAPQPHPDAGLTAQDVDQAIALIQRRLPISEARANEELANHGLARGPVDVRALARMAVRLGRHAPFHLIDLGGCRVIVRLSELTAARAAYRFALRAAAGWGATTVAAVAARLRVTAPAARGAEFVRRLLVGMAAFRWLDRADGWFWFPSMRNPLVNDLRKILSVTARIRLDRLWAALFRLRPGPPACPEAVHELCAAVPGTRVTAGIVTIDRPPDPRGQLGELEGRLARLLAASPAGLREGQIRGMIRMLGLPWTGVARLLRSSPVVERGATGLYRLVGSPSS
jgi:hypothetical protein